MRLTEKLWKCEKLDIFFIKIAKKFQIFVTEKFQKMKLNKEF